MVYVTCIFNFFFENRMFQENLGRMNSGAIYIFYYKYNKDVCVHIVYTTEKVVRPRGQDIL